jgi:hypothetical protein
MIHLDINYTMHSELQYQFPNAQQSMRIIKVNLLKREICCTSISSEVLALLMESRQSRMYIINVFEKLHMARSCRNSRKLGNGF